MVTGARRSKPESASVIENDCPDRDCVDRNAGIMRRTIVASIAVLALGVAGCSSSDPTAPDEYQALDQELAAADQQLVETELDLAQAEAEVAAITSERDALAQAAIPGDRYDNVVRIQSELIAILDDPEAFGTEHEIADLLASHATPGALMDNDEDFHTCDRSPSAS